MATVWQDIADDLLPQAATFITSLSPILVFILGLGLVTFVFGLAWRAFRGGA